MTGKGLFDVNEKVVPTHTGIKRFFGLLCFCVFGMVGFIRQGGDMNLWFILYGVLTGLIFGSLSMLILAIVLRIINPKLKLTQKKGFARRSVSEGMVYMVPFAVMAVLAAFFLNWSSAGLFVSAAIAAAASATGGAISRLYDKPRLLNNVVPSVIASACSMVWLFFVAQVQSVPSMVAGIVGMLSQLSSR
jgi:hypothetical protein